MRRRRRRRRRRLAAARDAVAAVEDMSSCDLAIGFLKNWWLMLVNALFLLFFHYFLTCCVLWYMFNHAYDSDPYPFDQATDFARTEAKNWTMGDRWNSHFVQRTCESDLDDRVALLGAEGHR